MARQPKVLQVILTTRAGREISMETYTYDGSNDTWTAGCTSKLVMENLQSFQVHHGSQCFEIAPRKSEITHFDFQNCVLLMSHWILLNIQKIVIDHGDILIDII